MNAPRLTRTLAPALTALTLTLTGCGGGEGGLAFLSIGTAGTGGIYYPLGGALASRLSLADSARRYTAEVSGGSVENVNRLAAGQIDLGFTLAVTAYQAYHGEGDFSAPVPQLRAVAPLYPNLAHILVPRGSRAASVADFRGLRVSVGAAGSGTEQMARHILEAHGLTYDDIEPRYLSFNESASALRDGAIDAAIFSVGYPAAAVLEATTTAGVRLLPVAPEVTERLRAEHPYYARGEIPAGAYRGVDAPVPTVVVLNWIVATESLPDDVVTALLNILDRERVALEQVHEMARQIDLTRLPDAPIPLHPAAQAWWEARAAR